MKPLIIFISTLLITLFSGYSTGEDSAFAALSENHGLTPYVDDEGNISRPVNFRKNWTHLGSWFVKNPGMPGDMRMHDVYATPESVKDFRNEGEWPDGAILVKTVSSVKSKQLTTGEAHWTDEIDVWFVMVRDRKNRFPDNKAWGEGWGWALFTREQPDRSLTTNWKGTGLNNCFGCHTPAKKTDWVYIEGYPTLRGAADKHRPGDKGNLSLLRNDQRYIF